MVVYCQDYCKDRRSYVYCIQRQTSCILVTCYVTSLCSAIITAALFLIRDFVF